MIQKLLMGVRLRRHVEKRAIMKFLMGSLLSSNSSWWVSRDACFVGALFFSTQCGFSGNRRGASSWTTRPSPRTKTLKMQDFLKRAMFATFFLRHHIHSCMSLCVHEQPLLTQPRVSRLVCTGLLQLLGGLPCTCFVWLFGCATFFFVPLLLFSGRFPVLTV